MSLCEGNSIINWINDKFSSGNVLALLLFNHSELLEITSYTADSLWFLLALAYIYAPVYCLGVFIHKNILIILCLLGCALVIGHYLFTGNSVNLLGDSFNSLILVDNWLIEGLFFFLMGYLIKRNMGNMRLPKLEKKLFLLVLGVLQLETIIESLFYTSDIYIGSFISVVFVFLYADRMSSIRIPLLDYIGKNLSANVYYWHVFIKALVVFIMGVGFLVTGKWILPFIVVLLTIFMSQLLYVYKMKINK